MLQDNALLLRAYLHWFRLSGDPLAERITRETAEFLLADLRLPGGAFASSLSAETDGVEGATYVWSPAEVAEVLGREDGARAAELLGVTAGGTYEGGRSTLRLLADASGLPAEWPRWRAALRAARDRRPQPDLDDKVVASWNGLAIAALAEAGAVLGEPAWVAGAEQAARFVLEVHAVSGPETRLRRISRNGQAGRAGGTADDYGNLAEGLLALHQATGEDHWLESARGLLETATARFADSTGGFYDTPDDADALLQRPRTVGDNAEPCGTSALAGALLTYSALTGDLRAEAQAAISAEGVVAARSPRFAGWTLALAEAAAAGPRQVAILGGGDSAAELVAVARASASPGQVTLAGDVGSDHPLLAGRTLVEGRPAAYVCEDFACRLPVTTVAELRAAL